MSLNGNEKGAYCMGCAFLLVACETSSNEASSTNLEKEKSNKTTEELNVEKQTSDIEKKVSEETI